jgi:hypothetical protein
MRHSGEACAGLDPVAGIQEFQLILDAESVIPDLIRDRHDEFGIFYETNLFGNTNKRKTFRPFS